MTRVLVIEPTGEMWGSERALLDLIDSAKDLEISVCCPPGAPLIPELKARGVRVFAGYIARLDTKPRWQRALAAVGVLKAALALRPDVIHLNQSGAYKVAMPAAVLLNLPIVGHVRIFEDAAYLARQNPRANRLKSLVAISDAIATELRRHPSLSAIAVHRIYDAYARRSACEPGSSETGRIACIGRVTPVKGQEVLLEALATRERLPGLAECLIVGEGEDEYVRRLRETPGGADPRVKWLGFVQDVNAVLSTCQVLACPSHREPLGRVILEAWDAGVVPVAYAGGGGAAEMIAAAGGGLLYREQTPECLAHALADALRLPSLAARRYVANGRAWMAANCGLERYGHALAHVFASAVSPSPPATR